MNHITVPFKYMYKISLLAIPFIISLFQLNRVYAM